MLYTVEMTDRDLDLLFNGKSIEQLKNNPSIILHKIFNWFMFISIFNLFKKDKLLKRRLSFKEIKEYLKYIYKKENLLFINNFYKKWHHWTNKKYPDIVNQSTKHGFFYFMENDEYLVQNQLDIEFLGFPYLSTSYFKNNVLKAKYLGHDLLQIVDFREAEQIIKYTTKNTDSYKGYNYEVNFNTLVYLPANYF